MVNSRALTASRRLASASGSLDPTMPARLKFDVYGKIMVAERAGSGWQLFVVGADGKRSPAQVVVPDFIQDAEVGQFLDDIFHEMATPARASIVQIFD